MYIDLMSQQNYINVNKKLIKLFGIKTALYWSELMAISTQVHKKKTYDEDGYFPLNRKYMQEQTTLTAEEQYECDALLAKAGVLEEGFMEPDKVRVNIELMVSLITSEDTKLLKSISKEKMSRAEKSAAKREGIKYALQQMISCIETDSELSEAYNGWVSSVLENKRPISKEVVKTFIADIKGYSTNKERQLEVIKLASIKAYTVAAWAIKLVGKGTSASTSRLNAPQNIATELSDVSF